MTGAVRAPHRPARAVAVLAVVGVLMIITGCAPEAGPGSSSGTSGPSSAAVTGPTPVSDEALAKAKKEAGIAGCPASDPDVPARSDGLPDLTLDCLGGGRQVRLAGLRGKPTVINIWAQWCRPCRQEAPHLATLSQRAGDKINFIGIDYQDPDPEAAIMFARISDWHYPQLQDPQREIRSELGIIGVPTTILVDADGKIVHRIPRPFSTEDQLRQAIHDHLGVEL